MNDIESNYSQEVSLENTLLSAVGPFWQSRNEGFIQGVDQKRIFWVSMTNPKHTKALFVVNGRIESAWKYQELFFEFYKQGYDIYSFDHRGQGLSQRLHSDPHLGHVERFEDYIQDMQSVLAHFDLSAYQQRFLLAHSMGGAISARCLETNPKIQSQFDAVIFSAPMFGISMSWYLRPIAYKVARIASKLSKIPTYAPGQSSYNERPFTDNHLTQSQPRYQAFRDLYQQMPELQLGGPSSHWVGEAIKAAKLCVDEAPQLTIPTLLLQALDDSIVDNKAQIAFMDNLGAEQSKFIPLESSRHEILFESDTIRDIALDHIFDFLDKQNNQALTQQDVMM